MTNITIHRFTERYTEGDLNSEDLMRIWEQLVSERLVHVFFHDGVVRSYYDFLRYVRLTGCWFYAARGADGQYLGLGVLNDFSSSCNTAYVHFVTFRAGRDGSFTQAARLWFPVLARQGELDTLIAVLPACYRAARAWTEGLGFKQVLRLSGALSLLRGGKRKTTDACVLIRDLRDLRFVHNQ